MIVIGAGVTGAAAAWQLARRGDRVTVPCAFTRADLEQLRLALPARVERRGPRTRRELLSFVARERAQLGV